MSDFLKDDKHILTVMAAGRKTILFWGNSPISLFAELPWWAAAPFGLIFGSLGAGAIYALHHVYPAVWRDVRDWEAALAFGGFIFIATVFFGAFGVLHRWERKVRLSKSRSLRSLKAMDRASFERLFAEIYRQYGYLATESGGGSNGGIDVLLSREGSDYIVHTRYWRTEEVEEHLIKDLWSQVARESVAGGIIVTCGGYSLAAKEYARDKRLDLIDGKRLLEMVNTLGPEENRPKTDEELDHEGQEVPPCPICRGPMVLKLSQRKTGINSSYWGCATYPICNGRRAHSAQPAPSGDVAPSSSTDLSPSCPACGNIMRLRTSQREEAAGARYWGCSTFPVCEARLGLGGFAPPRAD